MCLSIMHRRTSELVIPQELRADNVYNVSENGRHLVIFGLSSAYRCRISVHERNPASPIPHVSFAYNVVRDFANGLHVVIFSL